MNKLHQKFALIVILLLVSGNVFSQLKYEKESRLKRSEIPVAALNLLESIAVPGKIKWYLEEGLQGKTIEAKFRFNNNYYSIEFDTQGNLQDIEKTISFTEVPDNVKESVIKKLESEFSKFSITKTQVHYPGKNPEIVSIIRNPRAEIPNHVKYELIVNGKTGNTAKQYEMIFDHNGVLTGTKEIIQKNADNLEF